jgi:predicted HicB family RNase H-like nuclease
MQGDCRVTLLLRPELRERLRVAAAKCRTSMSRLVEKVLEDFLATGKAGD